ncbi:phostensin isoform X1 [Saccopteryx leptura]|uniref:phostensin isoform X1 n=2 Tax=Saccopteryx leptura TaxID=249018 RepID=UPI00339CE035
MRGLRSEEARSRPSAPLGRGAPHPHLKATMATIPDWKLQLLARRRQEEAAVRGREKAERERLSQMPAWKRGLLERRRAKLGLSPGEPSPASGTTEAGPPDPDKSAVLLEAIGPVHQNRFIRQERQQQQQQRSDEPLADRRPGPLETREWRPSPGETRDSSPKGGESREERLSPREARERRLGVGGARESSPRPSEARDWRQSPGEAGDRSRLSEAWRWKLSPGETQERSLRPVEPQEQSPRRGEVVDSRLSPAESDSQQLGLTETPTWRPESAESREQSLLQPEASAGRPDSGGRRQDSPEECGRREDRPAPRLAPEEVTGPSETPTPDAGDSSSGSGAVWAAERRPSPVEDGEGDLRLTQGWKWILQAGKGREWTSRDPDTQTQKPAPPPEAAEKPLGPLRAEAEKEAAGAQGRPPGALQNRCAVPCPLPPEEAGTGGSRPQEEEAAELRPPPSAPLPPPAPAPAPAAPQSPGDPLMSRLFYGVKAGPGVGAPRRSGHTFTVNPRRSVPPAAPAAPAAPDAVSAGKKRYPTAEEILVLGGYLRLSRSCLAKGSPERHHKQLKISFSETALETTFQYPSESSVLEELGPEPESPSAPSAAAAQPDDDEDEEELQRELLSGLRTKALIVDESCRR